MKFNQRILSITMAVALMSPAICAQKLGDLTSGNIKKEPVGWSATAKRAPLAPELKKAIKKAQEVEVIDSVKGERQMLTIQGTGYFVDDLQMSYIATFQDRATIMVTADDGYVYIKNPLTFILPGTYMKAKIEGDKMIVDLPQLLYEANEQGQLYQYYLNRMVIGKDQDGANWMFVDQKNPNRIEYELDGDQWVMECPAIETVLGLTDENGVWTGVGDENIVMSPFYETPQLLAEDAETVKWAMTYNGDGKWVNVVPAPTTGGQIAIEGFFREMPYSVVYGNCNGDKAFFESGQYLGVYNGYHTYFMGGSIKEYPDLSGEMQIFYALNNGVTFDFDAEKDLLTMAEGETCFLNSGCEYGAPYAIIKNAKINAQHELTNYIPQDPIVEYCIQEINDTRVDASVRFSLPVINTADELLDVENMYYYIWHDDHVYEHIPGPLSDWDVFTRVPYNFSDSWDFWVSNTDHLVYFYKYNVENVGVQSVYEHEGVEYKSNVVYTPMISGVENIKDAGEIVKTQWYDINGVQVTKPSKGIFIKRSTLSDGNIRTQKVILK